MLNPSNELFFGIDWDLTPKPVLSNFTLPPDIIMNKAPLLEFTIPGEKPPVGDAGTYTFAIAAFKTGTVELMSNLATVSFSVVR